MTEVTEIMFPRQPWGVLIRLGYSGSRDGMTAPQMRAVFQRVSYILTSRDWEDPLIVAQHGDCLGGDAQFHVIATVLGCRTVAHPPANPALRAWCKADEIRAPKGYLARDWDIASETGELLAAPKSPVPDRSGTWTTIGYAVQMNHPVSIFLPDGTLKTASDFGLRRA